MQLQTMSEAEFDAEILGATQPVLVDFATYWCPPCRVLAPILDALVAERGGRLILKSIDAEASRALSIRYDVRSFPTVIAFSGGREVGRAIGLMPKAKLIERLKL
jgi:thioredoxin 1